QMLLFFQRSIYNASIFVFKASVRLASLFNPKARLLIDGQKNLLAKIAADLEDRTDELVWFHCASLGEFEQGRPVIEAFRQTYPDLKILLTFFSPSGYEIRKNYSGADYIFYLPIDTVSNARRFVNMTNPKLVIFVKYEFWYHYLTQLKKADIPVLLISAIFRKQQIFFKPYGQLQRKLLRCFQHIFVQNQNSLDLLQGIGITSISIGGDTRFDRVSDVAKNASSLPLVESFIGASPVMVVGSCWPDDMDVLIPFINSHQEVKFILAPHEMNETFFNQIEKKITRSMTRYTQVFEPPVNADVLLVDKVGLLSSLYQYGNYAFIGGAYGQGLHNILEAAAFGIPIFFGDRNYKKFQEAIDLIRIKGAFAIKDTHELEQRVKALSEDKKTYREVAHQCRTYVQGNVGATRAIMKQIHELHAGQSI
ncbi:MAG: 3-deoxy-D-manno-octulosonic acid transferase, partial [Cyclobacteriaceae bacterium]